MMEEITAITADNRGSGQRIRKCVTVSCITRGVTEMFRRAVMGDVNETVGRAQDGRCEGDWLRDINIGKIVLELVNVCVNLSLKIGNDTKGRRWVRLRIVFRFRNIIL